MLYEIVCVQASREHDLGACYFRPIDIYEHSHDDLSIPHWSPSRAVPVLLHPQQFRGADQVFGCSLGDQSTPFRFGAQVFAGSVLVALIHSFLFTGRHSVNLSCFVNFTKMIL